MVGSTHRLTTLTAFEIHRAMKGETVPLYLWKSAVIPRAAAPDHWKDVEFVDVEQTVMLGSGRDNPHSTAWDVDDDIAHYTASGNDLTGMNHFIDIRKGKGEFDDYDGYAYHRGSAGKGEYQDSDEMIEIETPEHWYDPTEIYDTVEDSVQWLIAWASGKKVDEGLMWYVNDEYVHAPGQKWYRYGKCSPALENYSRFQETGTYASLEDECAARFPLATALGGKNKGVPYSVFMPIDNLANYWWGYMVAKKDPRALGAVLHAIQDAAIPHHAAGCNGNWHRDWERSLKYNATKWLGDDTNFTSPEKDALRQEVRQLVDGWMTPDPNPPSFLERGDWRKKPSVSWPIDQLVTWMALHAYKSYRDVYKNFKDGYTRNEADERELAKLATALSVLVLVKAEEHVSTAFVANKRTKEFHTYDCLWAERMSIKNRILCASIEEAKRCGYDGCHYCLDKYDKG